MENPLDLFEALNTPRRVHVERFETETADGIIQRSEKRVAQYQRQVRRNAEKRLTAVSLVYDEMSEEEQAAFGICSRYFFRYKYLASSHMRRLQKLVKKYAN